MIHDDQDALGPPLDSLRVGDADSIRFFRVSCCKTVKDVNSRPFWGSFLILSGTFGPKQ